MIKPLLSLPRLGALVGSRARVLSPRGLRSAAVAVAFAGGLAAGVPASGASDQPPTSRPATPALPVKPAQPAGGTSGAGGAGGAGAAGGAGSVAWAPVASRAPALRALLDEQYEQMMKEAPVAASQRGDDRWATQLQDVSPAAISASLDAYRARLARLNGIDERSLNDDDRLDAGLLRLTIEQTLDGARFHPEQMPIDDREGVQISLPNMPDQLTLRSPKQLADYAARLEAVAKLVDDTIANMRAGLAAGRVPPRVTVVESGDQAAALASMEVQRDPTRSVFYRPFLGLADGDASAARARRAVSEGITPAYLRLAAFLRTEYTPKCRETIAASEGIDGLPAYESALRRHTTTTMSADEIHALGQREVARIRREMFGVIARSDFAASSGLKGDELFRAFVAYLRTDKRFYHASKESLLNGYRDICKRIDPDLARLFGTLPRNPYGVRETPAFAAPSSTTAYYMPGSLKGGAPGYFVANTYRLDQRPRYEMTSLTLHEAVPGHHLQIMLADELEGVHPFRQLLGYTVFVEGWALYAERLGLEMNGAPPRREVEAGSDDTGGTGLYTDPYDDFGRLTYEMWRACRLVVDTGMHAKGWTRQQSIDFMSANSALTQLNIEREVDRYIAWPGQACGYKLGELKIRELRRRAEQKLGERFNLRTFHDSVLLAGALPLAMLEQRVDAYIAREASAAAAGGSAPSGAAK